MQNRTSSKLLSYDFVTLTLNFSLIKSNFVNTAIDLLKHFKIINLIYVFILQA